MTDLAHALLTLAVQLRKAGGGTFAPFGFTWREAVMLLYIEQGHMYPTDLSKEFGTVFPVVSGLGAKFVDLGLIRKEAARGGTDRRQVMYVLTRKGETVCQQLRQAWEANLPIDRDNLTEDEIETFSKVVLNVQKV